MSELARRAEIAKPTCIGIVKALTDAGYLDRDPRTKTYGLGPSLITAGRAAIEGLAPAAVVQSELSALSEAFHLPATAAVFRSDHLTIIERTGPPSVYDPLIQVGVQLPLIPPTGKMGIIFSDDEQVTAWLRREPADSDHRIDVDRLWAVIGEAREAGYLVTRSGESSQLLAALLKPLGGKGVSDELVAIVSQVAARMGDEEYLREELKPGCSYQVSTVSAPAYDANGRVKLLVVLYVVAESVRYSDIHAYGEALVAVGDRLTGAIGGHHPYRHAA